MYLPIYNLICIGFHLFPKRFKIIKGKVHKSEYDNETYCMNKDKLQAFKKGNFIPKSHTLQPFT